MHLNEFKPIFKGCVVIPLTDDDEDVLRIRYLGDWENKRKQFQIMKKPRKYCLNFHFKGFDGEKGVERVRILDGVRFDGLSDYIKTEGDKLLAEIGGGLVDLKNSYVSIRA